MYADTGAPRVVADSRNPITVIVSDRHIAVAPPGSPDRTDLTTEEIEHVTIEALSSRNGQLGRAGAS